MTTRQSCCTGEAAAAVADPPPIDGRFKLSDHFGREVCESDFGDRLLLLFFGFIHCQVVCPRELAKLSLALEMLGEKGMRLQPLFVTVDPERDTAEVMRAYTAAFDPTFVALIPSQEQLAAMAKDFKVYYKKVEGKTPTSYSMDHSAASFIYDPQGRLRLYARYGAGVPALTADVKALLG